jgi:hypothetical protein
MTITAQLAKNLRDVHFGGNWTWSNLKEQLADSILSEDFTDKKYGSYYRNIIDIIEHMHYHLGQIAILKKIIRQKGNELT